MMNMSYAYARMTQSHLLEIISYKFVVNLFASVKLLWNFIMPPNQLLSHQCHSIHTVVWPCNSAGEVHQEFQYVICDEK